MFHRPIRAALTITTLFLIALPAAALAQSRVTILSPQEPGTLLPHFDLLSLTHEVEHLVFDCLFSIDASGETVARLALEVPDVANGGISSDGRTYTIRLREDVSWQDGTPFTSEDVRFTWQVITDPDLPVPNRNVWQDIVAVETPDPHTAILQFADTNVGFVATASTNACFILPAHLLDGEDLVTSPFNREPLGTGPYRIIEWSSGSFIRLEKNPDFWGGEPAIDEIVFSYPGGSQGIRTALQRGEAELALHLTTTDVRFVETLEAFTLVRGPSHAWWQFWINNADPILGEHEVRAALAHGLDKQTITETVMGGLVEPQDAVISALHWTHNPDVTRYPFDPEEARALLERAGWTDEDGNGLREKGGQPLQLEVLNIAGQVERRQVVQIAQDFWRDVGFDVSIREIDAASFPPTMREGAFQLAYGSFGENEEPVFNLWLGTNWQNYSNQEALDLLRQVPSTVDRDARRELVQRFQELAAQDAAILPLAPRPLLNAVADRLQGYTPSLSGSLWNAEEWSLR